MAPALLYGLIAAGAAIVGAGVAIFAKRRPSNTIKMFGPTNMVKLANNAQLPSGKYKLLLLPQGEEVENLLKKHSEETGTTFTEQQLAESYIFAIKDENNQVVRVNLVQAKEIEPEIDAVLKAGKSAVIQYSK